MSGLLRRACCRVFFLTMFCFSTFTCISLAQDHINTAQIVEGGPPLQKKLSSAVGDTLARSVSLWIRLPVDLSRHAVAIQLGEGEQAWQVIFHNLHPAFRSGTNEIVSAEALPPGVWHHIVAEQDGSKTMLFVDGKLARSGVDTPEKIAPILTIAPLPFGQETRFSGDLGAIQVLATSLSPEEVEAVFRKPPDFEYQLREKNDKPWPLQTHQQVGYTSPQTLDRLPHGTPASRPMAVPASVAKTLSREGDIDWELSGGWKLLDSVSDEPPAAKAGEQISMPGFASGDWLSATVPGTVLTTLIDRGIYPDPDVGLNNLAIPESLNKHPWWYRVEFQSPESRAGRRWQLRFAGINYQADVWLNGTRLGDIRGAFHRGNFDITELLHPTGTNALAVRISPPPHPGIPQEQSLVDGPGENGGSMLIDGPTFVATEGWDWLPAIRDRNSGIWQAVSLHVAGAVTIGDPRVVTQLPLPDTSSADVNIDVPLRNSSKDTISTDVAVAFEGVAFSAHILAPPGNTILRLRPSEYSALHLIRPRLWWPNGYGAPELYHLKLKLNTDGGAQEEKAVTFGVREITYELTLFNHAGRLQRVEAIPQKTLETDYDPVDVHHSAMRQTTFGWASTITREVEESPAIRSVSNESEMTDLAIKVNGIRIAVRGGNWGMDDSRKRVSRERMEPYFRLHREANLNIIRNWVGQNTEETFYDLADEYGLLVWNDFWSSTQNYNAEPGDLSLFVENARDVVRRDRNHPSIVLWCGRNEGVPPPALNDAMIAMLHQEDGTRFYSPSSNAINLRSSGPYSWQDPVLYFSKLDRGFSVEVGISSFPTREAFEQAIPAPDRWPISDSWAYHDWHQAGGGDTHELMRHVSAQLGVADSLQEFERRIQLFNYVDHQAIFEGFYQHLWQPNSGRLIWMTHPSWPSTMWQMYSSDYDTQASYYAVRKANAPLHVQMDRSNGELAVVNTTRDNRQALHVTALVFSDGRVVSRLDQNIDAPANSTSASGNINLVSIFSHSPLAFVRLELRDPQGSIIADNFYWIAKDEKDFRAMNDLVTVKLEVNAIESPVQSEEGSDDHVLEVHIANHSTSPAIAAKLTLLRNDHSRVLPAYYSDNYVSLLPGEERLISIHVPKSTSQAKRLRVAIRGWNIREQDIAIRSDPYSDEAN